MRRAWVLLGAVYFGAVGGWDGSLRAQDSLTVQNVTERDTRVAAAAVVANIPFNAAPVSAPHLADADAQPPTAAKPIVPTRDTLTIVLGGDLGLGGSDQPVHLEGAIRHGARQSWAELTRGLASLMDGDINFANLETVVTDRNDLNPVSKAFNFRSHPAGIRHLLGVGLNVVSTANNHAIDYGEPGIRETLHHLSGLSDAGLKGLPGIGIGRAEVLAPADIEVKNARVRISAIGIGGGGLPTSPQPSLRAGMASYQAPADFRDIVHELATSNGDIRMLSVHYGTELQVRPSATDERRLRMAAVAGSIDIIAGHHAHVAAGVQEIDGRLIFYGLGNLLHPGMQNMDRLGICRDYGILARVHLARAAGERFRLRAIEIVTLRDMHQSTRVRDSDAGRLRIEVLNHLAAGLDDRSGGARGVRFAPQVDGSGLYCAPEAAANSDRIGRLCQSFAQPEPPPPALARRITQACGGSDLIAHRQLRLEPDAERSPSTKQRVARTNGAGRITQDTSGSFLAGLFRPW